MWVIRAQKRNKKHLPPVTCGTRPDEVGCYVPILTRCPERPSHRADERRGYYSRVFLIALLLKISYNGALPNREVAEWSKAHAWNACIGQPIEGSNPFLSAITPLIH